MTFVHFALVCQVLGACRYVWSQKTAIMGFFNVL